MVFIIALAGCASKPKIIITPLKTTEKKLLRILKEFKDSEFEIIINRKYDIHKYSNSVIVHSSDYQSYSLALKIQKRLIAQQLVSNIELREDRHQNHSFTSNNLGIFIVEEDGIYLVGGKKNYDPAETVAVLQSNKTDYSLGHMYTSYDCDFKHDTTYRFWDDYSFEMESRLFADVTGRAKFYRGHWIYNNQPEELYLSFDSGKALSVVPAVKRFFSNDGWVMRRALEFKYSTDEDLTGNCSIYLVEEQLQ